MAGAALNRALLARHAPDALLRRSALLVLAAGAALLLTAWTGPAARRGCSSP